MEKEVMMWYMLTMSLVSTALGKCSKLYIGCVTRKFHFTWGLYFPNLFDLLNPMLPYKYTVYYIPHPYYTCTSSQTYNFWIFESPWRIFLCCDSSYSQGPKKKERTKNGKSKTFGKTTFATSQWRGKSLKW